MKRTIAMVLAIALMCSCLTFPAFAEVDETIESLEPNAPVTLEVTQTLQGTALPTYTTGFVGTLIEGKPLKFSKSTIYSDWFKDNYAGVDSFTSTLYITTEDATPVYDVGGVYSVADSVFKFVQVYPAAGDYKGTIRLTHGTTTVTIPVGNFTTIAPTTGTHITTQEQLETALRDTGNKTYTIDGSFVIDKPLVGSVDGNSVIIEKDYKTGTYNPGEYVEKVVLHFEGAGSISTFPGVTFKGINFFRVDGGQFEFVLDDVGSFQHCDININTTNQLSGSSVIRSTSDKTKFEEVVIGVDLVADDFYMFDKLDGGDLSGLKASQRITGTNGGGIFRQITNKGSTRGFIFSSVGTLSGDVVAFANKVEGDIKGLILQDISIQEGSTPITSFNIFNNVDMTTAKLDDVVVNISIPLRSGYTGPIKYAQGNTVYVINNFFDATEGTKEGLDVSKFTNSYIKNYIEPEINLGAVDIQDVKTFKAPEIGGRVALFDDIEKTLPNFVIKSSNGNAEFTLTSSTDGTYYLPATITIDTKKAAVGCKIKWTASDKFITTISATTPLIMSSKDTKQINWVITPTTSTENIVFSSSDTLVATVDSTGLITAHKEGFATIFLKSKLAEFQIVLSVSATVMELWADRVLAITPPITLAHETEINTLNSILLGFKPAEVATIDPTTVTLFNTYKTALDAIERPEVVEAKKWAKEYGNKVMAFVVANLTMADESAIKDLRQEYVNATQLQISFVTPEVMLHLGDLEARILELKGVISTEELITDKISKLPRPENIVLTDEPLLDDIDVLIAQSIPPYSNIGMLEKFNACKAAIVVWKNAKIEYTDFYASYLSLPVFETLEFSHKTLVEKVTAEFKALSAKALTFADVAGITSNLKKYNDQFFILEEQEYVRLGKLVEDAIKKLNKGTLVIEDKEPIEEARRLYNALPDKSKPFVTNYADLVAIEDRFVLFMNDLYKGAVSEIEYEIEKLPKPEDLVLTECDKVTEVKAKYDALDEKAKPFVTRYPKLEKCVAESQELLSRAPKASLFTTAVSSVGVGNPPVTSWANIIDLYKQFVSFDKYMLRCLDSSIKQRIVELNALIVSAMSGEVADATTGFMITGPLGLKPSLKAICLTLTPNAGYPKLKADLEKASGKVLLSLYDVTLLDSGVASKPYDSMRILYPMQDVYSTYSNIGLVAMDSNNAITYIQPKLVTYKGESFYEYYAKDIKYVGIVASQKTFSWIFSFFGKNKLIPVVGKMLDTTYDIKEKPAKTNPANAG